MFKTAQEFTFTINQNLQEFNFIGQLVFKSKEVNSIGTLHTDDELEAFNELLNTALPVPEYWTLELIAKHIFDNSRLIFKHLHAVNVFVSDSPQRVSEYSKDYDIIDAIDGDILELSEIG